MVSVLGLVTFRIYPAEMGGQKGIAFFYRHLAAFHRVHLAVSTDNKQAAGNVLPVLYSNRQIGKNIWKIAALRSYIKKNKIDLIISEHSYPGWLAWLLSKSCGIPFIIHSHNIEAFRFREMGRSWWRSYLSYERWIHRKADHNFFISDEDQAKAISLFNLQPDKCSVVTYGIDDPLIFGDKKIASPPLLLFNGSLDYAPNQEAVKLLVEKVNPLLRKKLGAYKIIITGKGASKELEDLMAAASEIEYRGFVEDLRELFASAAVFLNPVLNDTGIKTKVVEAIAHHCPVVSTVSGAHGMAREACGGHLKVVEDEDWTAFTDKILSAIEEPSFPTPVEFYQTYSWKTIAEKAGRSIAQTVDRYLLARYGK